MKEYKEESSPITSSSSSSSWTFTLRLPSHLSSSPASSSSSSSSSSAHPSNVVQLVSTLNHVPNTTANTNTNKEEEKDHSIPSTTNTKLSTSDTGTTTYPIINPAPEETETLLKKKIDDESSTSFVSSCCWSLTASTTTTTTTTTSVTSIIPLKGKEVKEEVDKLVLVGLESQSLLQLSYRPAWQGIPEYTQRPSQLVSLLTSCCCNTNQQQSSSSSYSELPSSQENSPQQISDVYTTNDIIDYEYLSSIEIRGIGKCQAIQVYLTPHFNATTTTSTKNFTSSQEEDENNNNKKKKNICPIIPIIPQYYETAMKEHLYRISSSPDESKAEPTSSPSSSSSSSSQQPWTRFTKPRDSLEEKKKNGKNQEKKKKIDSDSNINDDHHPHPSRKDCIVITFAMPLLHGSSSNAATAADDDEDDTKGSASPSTSPSPLLWKVELPAPRNQSDSLLVDSITVLDGKLVIGGGGGAELEQPSSRMMIPNPTHVYINGYQSWSFAGSVTKGDKQPQSAMPNLFSGAFNRGGTLPSDTTQTKTTQWIGGSSGSGNNDSGGSNPPPTTRFTKSALSSSSEYYQSNFFTCITTAGQGQQKRKNSNGDNDGDGEEQDEDEHIILDENGGNAIVLGWLSQHEQFGILRISKDLTSGIEMHASHKGLLLGKSLNEEEEINSSSSSSNSNNKGIVTDWAYGQLLTPIMGEESTPHYAYDEEPMAYYVEAVASHHQTSPLHNGPILTGWCSWYHYYENINTANIRTNVSQLAELKNRVFPTNLVMVDDGYMTAWGDWDSFPIQKFHDMSIVARDIRAQGMKPGIWLAPFACDKHSTIVTDHPKWIIRNDKGRPANSSNCGKFFYGLDATNPEVLQHVTQSIKRAVQEWGFEVLKIDFLYAACLEGNGKYDLSMSRAQAMHQAMQTIRQAAGSNVFLIGCGCPLGSGIGYVDGMRVSADTGPTWYPALPLPWWDHGGTLPAVRAMVRNTLCRSSLGHRWWHNDPDCLLIRDTTPLTTEEVISAATVVAMSGGMMLLSDDLTLVSPMRLDIVIKMYPLTGATGIVLDLHNNAHPHSLPQLVRLWCTDQYYESLLDDYARKNQNVIPDCNDKATYLAQHASFQYSGHHDDPTMSDHQRPMPPRQRSCVHVAPGLGTWTVISLSNWADRIQVLEIPPAAFVNAIPTTSNTTSTAKHGYHIFAFWSSRYSWLAHPDTTSSSLTSTTAITKRMVPHETEIFHIKPVTPDQPQYIGSDFHFSCGVEVVSFGPSTKQKNQVQLVLKTTVERTGNCFLFIPVLDTRHVRVMVAGKPTRLWTTIGNVPLQSNPSRVCGRIIRISIIINPHRNNIQEGQVIVDY